MILVEINMPQRGTLQQDGEVSMIERSIFEGEERIIYIKWSMTPVIEYKQILAPPTAPAASSFCE